MEEGGDGARRRGDGVGIVVGEWEREMVAVG